jgi:hypothetical protein
MSSPYVDKVEEFEGVNVKLEYEEYGNDAWITITKNGKIVKKINFFGNDYGQLCTIDQTPESDLQRAINEDLPQLQHEEYRREAEADYYSNDTDDFEEPIEEGMPADYSNGSEDGLMEKEDVER